MDCSCSGCATLVVAICPLFGVINPAMARIRVVLPTPLGPLSCRLSPGLNLKLKSLINNRLPRLRCKFLTRSSMLYSFKGNFVFSIVINFI